MDVMRHSKNSNKSASITTPPSLQATQIQVLHSTFVHSWNLTIELQENPLQLTLGTYIEEEAQW